MRVILACVLFTTAIVPVMAEDLPLKGTWIKSVATSGLPAREPWGEVKQVYQMSIGNHAIVLEETPIAEIAAALGGASHNWGDAGGAVIWACFARGAETLWLYSDGEMGDGKVTGIGIDVRDAAPASAQCAKWPATLAVDLGVMGIGMPADVIVGNYLTSEPDEYGWMRSINVTPHASIAGFSVWEELTFRASEDGTINAVAVFLESGD